MADGYGNKKCGQRIVGMNTENAEINEGLIKKGLVIKWMPPTDYNTARSIRKISSD